MANFTLDDIREAANKKYANSTIDLGNDEVVELLNPLRLGKDKRDILTGIGAKLEDENVDHAEVLADALRAASKTGLVEKLIKEIDGDLAVLMELFTRYTGETQAGEASASES